MDTHGRTARHRRLFLGRLGQGALGLGLGGALWANGRQAVASSGALPRVVVSLAHANSLNHLPLVLARLLGFFEAEGLTLDVLETDTDEAALLAVAKGTAHLACCAYPLSLGLFARGALWRSLVVQTRVPQSVFGVSVHRMGGFRKTADLRDKRIGLLSTGPCWMVMDAVLRRGGLTPGDVFAVQADDVGSLLASFRAGNLDAICLNDARMVHLEQQGDVRVVADTRSLKGTRDVFGGIMPGVVLCAPAIWLGQHAAVAQQVANGVVHALKWLQTAGPVDLIRMLPEPFMGRDRALFLAAFEKAREGYSVDGWMARDAAFTALATLRWSDPVFRAASIDIEHTYTNEFVQKAKQRFRV